MKKSIIEFLNLHQIQYEIEVDLRKKTWIHRGGVAGLYILPADVNQLTSISKYLYQNNIEFLLVGHTSNLYILNTTNIPVVVSTLLCNKYQLSEDCIRCEAGVSVIKLAKDMVNRGIKGFEYLTGLPGTVAAALYNNSSCKDNSISKLLISAEVLMQTGNVVTMYSDDFDFKFRTSVFKAKRVKGTILSVILKAENADAASLKNIAEKNNKERALLLEGHSKNLGCTVNQLWSLGSMPIIYRFIQFASNIILKVLLVNSSKRNLILKKQLFVIAGFKDVEPYVSDKNPIVFLWLDDGADKVFDRYLQFMEKVYKTNNIEIQIVQ